MSKISVSSIEGTSASGGVISVANGNKLYAPGNVVQVKHLTYTAQTSASANSLRMPIPNFYVDIVPKFINSKMIVITHLSVGFSATPEWSWFVDRTIGDGSPVQLGTAAYDGSRMNGYHGGPRDGSANNWTVETESFSHTVEDMPSTLQGCRYQVCFQNRWSNNALFYLNRSGDYPNQGYVNSGSSSITVMEIAQ